MGSAGRLRRGEPTWEVEGVASAVDSSKRRRCSRPGDSLMKVSCRWKPERLEDSLPLDWAEAMRTRPRRPAWVPGHPFGPTRPLGPGSGAALARGGGPRLTGFCMKGIRTGDFCVLCCLASRARLGVLGTSEALGLGKGPEAWAAGSDLLGRGWEAGEVWEELDEGVLVRRAGGVALLWRGLRAASSEILPGLCRLRDRCCPGPRTLVGAAGCVGLRDPIFLCVVRGPGVPLGWDRVAGLGT